MPLNFEQKQVSVNELSEVAKKAVIGVTAEYAGLSVTELTELRKQARAQNIHLQVVRNKLAKRAFEDTEFSCLNDSLVGPLLIAFSMDDPGAPARLIKKFSEDHENLKVKALAMGGQAFPSSELKGFASLPTREEALAKLANIMQAPVTKFVRTLAEVPSKFVRVLAAVRDQKQG